jgi:prenyltransferase beta subunit
MSRRLLAVVILFAVLSPVTTVDPGLPGSACSAEPEATINADSAIAYVNSCRKPNGAFGPVDQEYTDAAWNYPAVHALRLLRAEIAKPNQIVANGLGYPTGHAGYGHWLVYHQAMTRWLLKSESDSLKPSDEAARGPVRLNHQGYEIRYYGSPFGTDGDHFFKTNGAATARQFRVATEVGYYNLSSLFYLLAALQADGRQVSNPQQLVKFVLDRQAPNGGFVDIRSADGRPIDKDTHIAHTFHAVASLRILKEQAPRADRCVRFARQCQVVKTAETDPLPGTGGFRFSPDPSRPGNYPDVYYTYAGLQVLNLLRAEPSAASDCRNWLLSLQNHDGGFGDRPGWRSRLYSTYYALHSLALLSPIDGESEESTRPLSNIAGTKLFGIPNRVIPSRRVANPPSPELADPSLKVYQGLFKTPLVTLNDLDGLRRRGFDLLAMKTDDFSTATPFQRADDRTDKPLSIVLCPEAYPHRLRRSGGTVLHHVGNFTLDPRWSESERDIWRAADNAGRKGLAWRDYQQQVLKPLQKIGSLCYPEQDFEYEFALSAYDDGLYGRAGYNAIQVGFNWSPRDFVRVFPWRERYTDKLPTIADADSHGDLKKWSPQLDHTRHLYVARSGSYADFQEAAKNGRVVCVVTGVEGVASGVSYYGRPEAVEFVKARVHEWKWW